MMSTCPQNWHETASVPKSSGQTASRASNYLPPKNLCIPGCRTLAALDRGSPLRSDPRYPLATLRAAPQALGLIYNSNCFGGKGQMRPRAGQKARAARLLRRGRR